MYSVVLWFPAPVLLHRLNWLQRNEVKNLASMFSSSLSYHAISIYGSIMYVLKTVLTIYVYLYTYNTWSNQTGHHVFMYILDA